MIKVKVYKNGNKTKSKYIDCPDGYFEVKNKEILEIIRDYPEQDFIVSVNDKGEMDFERLLSLIKSAEKEYEKCKDVAFLNRIIRNGGLCAYAKKLEGGWNI